jgi:hypothetical protein
LEKSQVAENKVNLIFRYPAFFATAPRWRA